jgi:glucose-6-phosphate isomerase
VITARFDLRELSAPWTAALEELERAGAVERLWSGDHTVVQEDPTECADRLGWLAAPQVAAGEWPRWAALADELVDGTDASSPDTVLVLGMGGSSLFPEVLARTFEPGDGFPALRILDSTHPAAVARALDELDPDRTLVVAASKSGSTVETRSHLETFWHRHPVGAGFAAITDPGSALEELAVARGFGAVVHGVPEIGGRFSALSAFGLFPAALMGLDGSALLDTAGEAAAVLGEDAPAEHHLGCQLGALMAVAATAGRDRLTLHLDDRLAAFGSWLEQLVAESTGKRGVGVLPVVGEPADAPGQDTRVHVLVGDVDLDPADLDAPSVVLPVEEPEDLGAQVFLWEFATAVAGVVLGINPFDQPDVESAKVAARTRLAEPGPTVAEQSLEDATALLRTGDVLVLTAFVDPSIEPRLQAARLALGRRAGVPTTLGIGPRFLHSTGQLHKGGADRQVVLQCLDVGERDVAVPGEAYTFGQLLAAQADGDLAALAAAGKRAARVPLSELLALA